jgi:transcriptional regulator with XRE-family HTH domain
MPPSILGQKIRQQRKTLGLSLDDLAARTNSSKSYIWELENKPVARPSAEKVAKIAAVLDVTPEFLVDETRSSATVDDRDKAFFRKYQGANPDVKLKIAQILKLLDE